MIVAVVIWTVVATFAALVLTDLIESVSSGFGDGGSLACGPCFVHSSARISTG